MYVSLFPSLTRTTVSHYTVQLPRHFPFLLAWISEDARAHGCRIVHGDAGDMDVDADPLPSKRRCTESTVASSRAISTLSQHSHKPRNCWQWSVSQDHA